MTVEPPTPVSPPVVTPPKQEEKPAAETHDETQKEEEKPKSLPVIDLPNRFDAFKKCANGGTKVTQEGLAACIKLIPGGSKAQE